MKIRDQEKEGLNEVEWIEKILEIKRVSKKTKGGNRIAFTVLAVAGNGKGKVGFALARGESVPPAIKKAVRKARQKAIKLSLVKGTIPHPFTVKFKGAKIVVKPGRLGSGLIAGSVVRAVAQAAGIEDLIAKRIGSANKNANLRAVFKGFENLRL